MTVHRNPPSTIRSRFMEMTVHIALANRDHRVTVLVQDTSPLRFLIVLSRGCLHIRCGSRYGNFDIASRNHPLFSLRTGQLDRRPDAQDSMLSRLAMGR